MDDEQLLRYSRQIMLANVGIEGQQALLDARVLIIGLGGLGAPVAMYLAAAGVGHLVIADHDVVELTNLQRQIIHSTDDLGLAKTISAANTLGALNPHVSVTTLDEKLDAVSLTAQMENIDVVVDCSDNFATRFAVNDACCRASIPLVSAAVIRMEGQISVFDFRDGSSPCYRCLYHEQGEPGESCSETGVLAPLPGIVGSVQATEALKLLLGLGQPLTGRVLTLDAAAMEWRTVKLKKDPHCPVCGSPA